MSGEGGRGAVQAWAWLEGSGLEANSTCMNAVMGALARNKGQRHAHGAAGAPPYFGAPRFMLIC